MPQVSTMNSSSSFNGSQGRYHLQCPKHISSISCQNSGRTNQRHDQRWRLQKRNLQQQPKHPKHHHDHNYHRCHLPTTAGIAKYHAQHLLALLCLAVPMMTSSYLVDATDSVAAAAAPLPPTAIKTLSLPSSEGMPIVCITTAFVTTSPLSLLHTHKHSHHYQIRPQRNNRNTVPLFAPPFPFPSLINKNDSNSNWENNVHFASTTTTTRRSSNLTTRTNQYPGISRQKQQSKQQDPGNQYSEYVKDGIVVGIERTSMNSRRISGELIMDVPMDCIWDILTDYDNLSIHVPNLMESRRIDLYTKSNFNDGLYGGVANGDSNKSGKPRVYQRGAQRIFGFEFGADVTMDMTERTADYYNPHHDDYGDDSLRYSYNNRRMSVDFECVDSQFFSQFDGAWILQEIPSTSPPLSLSPQQPNGRDKTDSPNNMQGAKHKEQVKTLVRYVVDVRPKGPVPVAALEWRIREDVPINVLAVSKAAKLLMTQRQRQQEQQEKLVVANSGNNHSNNSIRYKSNQDRQSKDDQRNSTGKRNIRNNSLLGNAVNTIDNAAKNTLNTLGTIQTRAGKLAKVASSLTPLNTIVNGRLGGATSKTTDSNSSLRKTSKMSSPRRQASPRAIPRVTSRLKSGAASPSKSPPSSTNDRTSQDENNEGINDNEGVGWYKDETMAVYLKD